MMKIWRIFPLLLVLVSCASDTKQPVKGSKHQFVLEDPLIYPYIPIGVELAQGKSRNPAGMDVNYAAEIESAKGTFVNRMGSDNSVAAAAGRMEKIFTFARNEPTPFFSYMRRNSPIYVSPGASGWTVKGNKSIPPIVLVTRYADVKNILDHNLIFTVKPYKEIMDATVGSPFMLGRDGDDVNDEKPHVRPNLSNPKDAAKVRAIVASLTRRAIATGAKNGEIDIVKSVTRAVPLGLNDEYFGFSGPSRDALARWSRATQHAFFHNPFRDKKVMEKSVIAGKEMRQYIRSTLIPERKRELANGRPANDIVSQILNLSQMHARFGVSDERIVANIIGLLVGSVETTSAAIAQSLQFILQNPAVRAQAIAAAENNDDEFLSAIVFEALRFDPVNPWLARYAEQDFTLGEGTSYQTVVKKGSLVLASTESAMWDSAVFPGPMNFRTDRDPASYMHLGYGYHRCLGDDVSMIMVPETIKQILLLKDVKIKMTSRSTGGIDQEGGPFPESFVLSYRPAGGIPGTSTAKGTGEQALEALRMGEFIVDKIANMDRRTEAMTAIRNVFSKNEDLRKKAIYDIPLLVVDAMKDTSEQERIDACMNKNPKSKEVFENPMDRKNYCEVRLDFRACYFTERLLNSQSSWSAYNHCVFDRGFLNQMEQVKFREQMAHMEIFAFLNYQSL